MPQPRAVPTQALRLCGGPACFWLQQEPQALHRSLHPPASPALLLPCQVRSGRFLPLPLSPISCQPPPTQKNTGRWLASAAQPECPDPREQKESDISLQDSEQKDEGKRL